MKTHQIHSKGKNTLGSKPENNSWVRFFSFFLVLNLTSWNALLSGILFTLEMQDLPFKRMSTIQLQVRTQYLWVSGSLQKQMLVTVNTTEKLPFTSDVEASVDLNLQTGSKGGTK